MISMTIITSILGLDIQRFYFNIFVVSGNWSEVQDYNSCC